MKQLSRLFKGDFASRRSSCERSRVVRERKLRLEALEERRLLAASFGPFGWLRLEASSTVQSAFERSAAFGERTSALFDVSPARAIDLSSIIVDSLKDDCDATDGRTTLREALEAANARAEPTTISFSADVFQVPTATITLTDELPTIVSTAKITIDASERLDSGVKVVLDGGGSARILSVAPDASATLIGLTLTNGAALGAGGAISNAGTLNVVDVVFESNAASLNGGAISNVSIGTTAATVSISGATKFIANTAKNGGAIYNYGDAARVSIEGTSATTVCFFGNRATSSGGAIAVRSGVLDVAFAEFSANESRVGATTTGSGGNGGAIYNCGEATVSNSSFTANVATFANGGALANVGTATLTDVSFSRNRAIYGGGIASSGTVFLCGTSTILNNVAQFNGGGISITNVLDASQNVVSAGKLVVSSGTTRVSGNVAIDGYGGGIIFVAETTLTVQRYGSLVVARNFAENRPKSRNISVYSVAEWNVNTQSTVEIDASNVNRVRLVFGATYKIWLQKVGDEYRISRRGKGMPYYFRCVGQTSVFKNELGPNGKVRKILAVDLSETPFYRFGELKCTDGFAQYSDRRGV